MKNFLLIILVLILLSGNIFLFKKEIDKNLPKIKSQIEQHFDPDVCINHTKNYREIDIVINVDAFARVFVNNRMVWSLGESRKFISLSNKDDKRNFHVKVIFNDGSHEEKDLILSGGDVAIVNFGCFKK